MPAGREGEIEPALRSPISPSTADGAGAARAGTPRPRCARPQRRRRSPPVARSYSSRPSSTLMVVSNEPRVEPLSCSQFQPPSAICSVSSRSTMPCTSWPKYAPIATARPLMHGSTSPSKNGRLVVLPAGVLADEGERAPRLSARRVEAEVAQQLERGGGRRPLGQYAPPPHGPSAPWAARSWAPQPSRGDLRALGRDLVGRRIGQVAHHLPADGGIGVEQPVDDVHALHGGELYPDTGRQDLSLPLSQPPPGSGFSHTETCFALSLVYGSRSQPDHRSRSRRPASCAMRSSSLGQTYLKGTDHRS